MCIAAALETCISLIRSQQGMNHRCTFPSVAVNYGKGTGTVLRNRDHAEKRALTHAFEAQLLGAFSGPDRTLRPVIDRILPWSDVARGHALLGANATTGKIVLAHRG